MRKIFEHLKGSSASFNTVAALIASSTFVFSGLALAQNVSPGAQQPYFPSQAPKTVAEAQEDDDILQDETQQPSSSVLAQNVSPGAVQPQLPTQAAPKKQTQEFDVPAVIDRPLGIDEGPKLFVKKLELHGVTRFPDPANNDSEIRQILTAAIESQGDGFTIGQLQALANEVTKFYRDRGYMLARAYVPMQNAQDGEVAINVVEGYLGDALVQGNERVKDGVLRSPFKPLIGDIVQKEPLETSLLLASDMPGTSIFGVLRPGAEVGSTDVVVNVQGEDMFEFFSVVDNYGTETTGDIRGILGANVNNLFGRGDQLRLLGLQTFDPEDSLYGSLGFEMPVWRGRTFAGLDVSYNDYTVDNEFLLEGGSDEIRGNSRQASVYLRHKWVRSRDLNVETKFAVYRKKAEQKFVNTVNGVERFQSNEDLGVVQFGVNFSLLDDFLGGGLTSATVDYSVGMEDFLGAMSDEDPDSIRVGRDEGLSLRYVDADFEKINISLSRLQNIGSGISLKLRAEGQYSDDFLSSLEQYAIGGPANVRAFPVSEVLGDKALFGSAELVFAAPGFTGKKAYGEVTWGQLLQFSIFYDAAEAKSFFSFADGSVARNTLKGYGAGLTLNFDGVVTIRLEGAKPDSPDEADNGDDEQFWASIGVNF